MPGSGLVDEVGEGDAVEQLSHLLGDTGPDLLQDAVALAVVVLTDDGDEWPVDGAEDVRQRDLCGRTGEHGI